MMAWEPVENGTYHTDGPELVKVSDAKLSIVRHNGNAYVDLQQGYALCRQVPDGGVLLATPERVAALAHILDNSIDEHNETYPETQAALATLRAMLQEMKGGE